MDTIREECPVHQDSAVCMTSDAIAADAFTVVTTADGRAFAVPDAAALAVQQITVDKLTHHLAKLNEHTSALAALGVRLDG